ncbi:MAG TPA: 3-deoxy-7-phosphoheptulonate synthase, partial [Clostridiales bacterium]|nr:3-deoxy-7-phosphoheptulonate synthase [Clostridiales bacterium]
MILVLKNGTKDEEILRIREMLSKYDVQVNPIVGTGTTILGLVGDTSVLDINSIYMVKSVEKIIKIQEPYKKSNRKLHPENTVVKVGDVEIGGPEIVIMAGPCSVESEEQITDIARNVKAEGAKILRGGAWKPRTSPYAF